MIMISDMKLYACIVIAVYSLKFRETTELSFKSKSTHVITHVLILSLFKFSIITAPRDVTNKVADKEESFPIIPGTLS